METDENVFPAHIEGERVQTVREHCEKVSEYAAEEARPLGLSSAARLAGLLHDVGKGTGAFREYIRASSEGRRGLQKVNHSSAGGRYLYEAVGDPSDAMGALSRELVAYAVAAHHGMFDMVGQAGEDNFQKRIYPEKDNFYGEAEESADFLDADAVREMLLEVEREIAEMEARIEGAASDMGKAQRARAGQFMLGALQRLELSFVVDGDWRDTSEFKSGAFSERLSREETLEKWDLYRERLEAHLRSFKKNGPLSRQRSEMSEQCLSFAERGNGIYRLAIPTGGGKTLAGLRYALALARREGKRHIYYAAPYLSILEQNAGEIRRILRDDACVVEHHSNVIVSDDDEGTRAFSEDWSEPVILTTLVQLLNAMFSGEMKSVRRFHQLAESVIIIEEAQSLPVKCLCMFATMANFLSRCCGTTFVICTATQPLFEKIEFPLLYSGAPDIVPEPRQPRREFERTRVINRADGKMDTGELASMALEVMEDNILIILNTKGAVQKLYEEIKSRADGERVICISTQLVEAARHAFRRAVKIVKSDTVRMACCIVDHALCGLHDMGKHFYNECAEEAIAF